MKSRKNVFELNDKNWEFVRQNESANLCVQTRKANIGSFGIVIVRESIATTDIENDDKICTHLKDSTQNNNFGRRVHISQVI